MSKRLIARGSDGLVSIHETGANFEDPWSNIGNIYFDSRLDYLWVNNILQGGYTFPSRNGAGTAFTNIGYHGLGYSPMIVGYTEGPSYSGPVMGTTYLDGDSWDGVHQYCFCADAANVYLYDSWYSPTGSGFPARGIAFDLRILGNVAF
ncbi:hypothetical protein Lumi_026 [Xylophilus phage Lumi]|nr:hypothetical protein Lumi_026 [Xylophilus phage Lumi]